MKALQSVHAANWVDVFLGLWTAALRLVYRVCMFEALCECKVGICSSFCVLFKIHEDWLQALLALFACWDLLCGQHYSPIWWSQCFTAGASCSVSLDDWSKSLLYHCITWAHQACITVN